MENFEIDEKYFTSVQEKTVRKFIIIETGEEMEGMFTGSVDHPEFSKLREQLGESGFIQIERGWWNGDCVLKPFSVNGFKFRKGEQFPCACAMSGHMKYK